MWYRDNRIFSHKKEFLIQLWINLESILEQRSIDVKYQQQVKVCKLMVEHLPTVYRSPGYDPAPQMKQVNRLYTLDMFLAKRAWVKFVKSFHCIQNKTTITFYQVKFYNF
jgi:hypothetical protein